MFLDRPLHLLRPKRTLLHRPLPPLFLLAHPLPFTPLQQRLSHLCTTGQPYESCGGTTSYTGQRMGDGARSREQNGQHVPLGYRHHIIADHAVQAVAERGAVDQGE